MDFYILLINLNIFDFLGLGSVLVIIAFILLVKISNRIDSSRREEKEAKRLEEIQNRRKLRALTLTLARKEIYINYEMESKYVAYLLYLNSPQWKETRRLILSKRGHYCEKCKFFFQKGLHLHHITYEDLFNEYEEDLMLLCKSCHETEHEREFDINPTWKKTRFNELTIEEYDFFSELQTKDDSDSKSDKSEIKESKIRRGTGTTLDILRKKIKP